MLRDAGIVVPDEVLITEQTALAGVIAGTTFPLAMKIQSRDIPHKSEAGGVRINLASLEEAKTAFAALMENARRFKPSATLQGVLVGPMAKKGIEMIVGTVNDATFGPIVMAGFGGVTTELFKDVVYRPAPVSEIEAQAMISELKSSPLLNGFRGAPLADKAALARLIAQVSILADDLRDDIAEIEINPVIVHGEGEGITVVDALVVGRRLAH